MDDEDDLIEAEGAIAFGETSMFGEADEEPESEAVSVFADDESENDLLEDYISVRDFGWTWEFDFAAGQFLRKGSGSQINVVQDEAAFAQWCMNVLHTERLTAFVYSDQIGVEFEQLVRSSGSAEIAAASIISCVEEALAVHDRFDRIEDFVASIENDYVLLSMTVYTTDGPVQIEGAIPA